MCEVPDSRPWGAGHRGAQQGTGIPGHLTRVLDSSWVLSPALPDEEGGDARSRLPQKCQGCLRALWTCGFSLPPGLPSRERQKECRDFPCWSWPDQEPCPRGAEEQARDHRCRHHRQHLGPHCAHPTMPGTWWFGALGSARSGEPRKECECQGAQEPCPGKDTDQGQSASAPRRAWWRSYVIVTATGGAGGMRPPFYR